MHTSRAAIGTPSPAKSAISAWWVRSTAWAENWPLAGAGWLVAMVSVKPAAESSFNPSSTPGKSTRWLG
jgi:hypothetical protein